jgi:murein DD-endopeptidase
MKHAVLALALLFALAGSAQLVVPPEMALDLAVPFAPAPVPANGKTQLVHELHVTNFRSTEVTLERVEVLAGDAVIATYAGPELAAATSRPGARPALNLPAGTRGIVFLWASTDRAPASVSHRVHYKLGEASAVVEGAKVSIVGTPVSLAPPLSGDRWVTSYGPSNDAPHRRTILPLQGHARIPQRFATDWVRIGPNGLPWNGDPSKNENWFGFGADVLAVADALVVDAYDALPDIPPPLPPQTSLALEHAGGNQVVLDLGHGRYAFYGHLKSGSVRVKKGDRVKRGQVLGLVGNSGNTLGPHLHFHVSNAITALVAEGLPYTLTAFEVIGHIESSEKLEAGEPWLPKELKSERRVNEMPVGDMVVRFGHAR